MNVKKILSIDFDIIMYPCINLYDGEAFIDESPTILWNKFYNKIFTGPTKICYDSNVLMSIGKLIHRASQNGATIIPIDSHEKIVEKLKNDENYDDTVYDMVNIDFHHDVWYDKRDVQNTKVFDTYTCRDWLGYLHNHNKLNTHVWVKAPNSEGVMASPYEFTRVCHLDEIESFELDSFDEIYFCFSPQWVPYEFKHLYDLIIALSER